MTMLYPIPCYNNVLQRDWHFTLFFSAVLASLCSLSGSTRCLYKYIFCDTSVHSSDPTIEVISPSIPTPVSSDSESSKNNTSITIDENDTRMNLLKGHPSFFNSDSNVSYEKLTQNQSSLFNSEQVNASEAIHPEHVNVANSNDDLFTMSDKVLFLDSSGSTENSSVSFEKLLKSESRLFSSEQENVSKTVKQAQSYDVNSCVDLMKMSDKVLPLSSTSYNEGVEPMKTAVNTNQAIKLEMLKQRKQAILIQKQKLLPAILQKNNNTICNSSGPSEESDQSDSGSKHINGHLQEMESSVDSESDNYLKISSAKHLRKGMNCSLIQHNSGTEVDEQTKEMVGETTGINHHNMPNDNLKEMKNRLMRSKGENQTNLCKLIGGDANTAFLHQSERETVLISSQSGEKHRRKTEIVATSRDGVEVDLDDMLVAKTKETVRTKVQVITRLLDLLEEFRNLHR